MKQPLKAFENRYEESLNLKKLIEVIYQDDYYIVFNKPAGLLVIPTPRGEKNTLENIVNHQYPAQNREYTLHPCHRLDRETSGVILFAKGKSPQKSMVEVFKNREIKKKYIAFVQGVVRETTGTLKGVIRDMEQRKFQKKSEGKFALTRFKVLERKKHFSVVEVEPVTGRTNQIRIQFGKIGHPLVGERKYAFGRDYKLKFRRAALHAFSLEWPHPVLKTKILTTAQLPEDMEVFLARNRN